MPPWLQNKNQTLKDCTDGLHTDLPLTSFSVTDVNCTCETCQLQSYTKNGITRYGSLACNELTHDGTCINHWNILVIRAWLTDTCVRAYVVCSSGDIKTNRVPDAENTYRPTCHPVPLACEEEHRNRAVQRSDKPQTERNVMSSTCYLGKLQNPVPKQWWCQYL